MRMLLGGAVVLATFAPQASPGMAGRWTLDESGGAVAADSSGSGNDGAHVGSPAFRTGADGPAFQFANPGYRRFVPQQVDGSDDSVDIPNSAGLENIQEGTYTISAWFRPLSAPQQPASNPPTNDETNRSAYAILMKQGAHEGLHYKYSSAVAGQGFFSMVHWTGATTAVAATSAVLPPNAWYHLAGLVDPTGGEVRLYVNGQGPDAGGLGGRGLIPPGSGFREYLQATWKIGIAAPGSTSYRWAAHGDIDDVRIYARALSDAEILALSQGGELDSQAPVVTITSPSAGSAAPGSPLAVSGTATDNGVINSITWTNATTGQAGVASGTGAWTASVPLARGANTITVTATDGSGNQGSASIAVTYDPPPGGEGEEGLKDGKCTCGTIGAGATAAWPAALALLALLLLLRR